MTSGVFVHGRDFGRDMAVSDSALNGKDETGHEYHQCIGYIVEPRANATRLLFLVILMLGVMTRICPLRESGETRAEADKLWTLPAGVRHGRLFHIIPCVLVHHLLVVRLPRGDASTAYCWGSAGYSKYGSLICWMVGPAACLGMVCRPSMIVMFTQPHPVLQPPAYSCDCDAACDLSRDASQEAWAACCAVCTCFARLWYVTLSLVESLPAVWLVLPPSPL
jgi:hypothetical protein